MTITEERRIGYGSSVWHGKSFRGYVIVHATYAVYRWDGEAWQDTGWRRLWWIENGLRKEQIWERGEWESD